MIVLIGKGLLTLFELALLHLKTRQSRREERSLVTPNERRVTMSGAFSGATRRAGTVFAPSGVIRRLCPGMDSMPRTQDAESGICRITTLRAFCLAGHKNSVGSANSNSVNRPYNTRLIFPGFWGCGFVCPSESCLLLILTALLFISSFKCHTLPDCTHIIP